MVNWKMNFGMLRKRNKIKVKVLLGIIPNYSNAKSLACDTANEHALERHAAAVRHLSNGTNDNDLIDLYIRIAPVGNTIQTVNSPIYEYKHEYSW